MKEGIWQRIGRDSWQLQDGKSMEGGLAVKNGVWQEYVRTGREMKQEMAHTLGPVLCNCRFLSILIVPVKSFLQKKR